jgi:hypothetical protein
MSLSPVGFEPEFSAGERPQTYALDRAATGTDVSKISKHEMKATATPAMYLLHMRPFLEWYPFL